MNKQQGYTHWQLTSLVILRVAIGWHFLYEGIAKLIQPNWTSLPYLMDSKGIMAVFFHTLGSSSQTVHIIDLLNIWGLIAIGAGLFVGLFTRAATLGGILLLMLYVLSHPPLAIVRYGMPSEGSYLYINKNMIEMAALWVTYLFNTGKEIGLDRLIHKQFCSQPSSLNK